MRKILLVAAGGAVGYVLGARAGRPAYDRIVGFWRSTSESTGLRDLGRTVGESAVDVREAAKERATRQVHDVMERTADAVSPDGGNGSRSVSGSADDGHQTIVAPTPDTI